MRNGDYGHENENSKEKCTISDESKPNNFYRKSNYHKSRIEIDKDLSESDSNDYSIEKLEIPNWDDIKLNKIEKDIYKPSTKTQNRYAQEVDAFHTKMQIKIDSNAPKPIFEFNELNGADRDADKYS